MTQQPVRKPSGENFGTPIAGKDRAKLFPPGSVGNFALPVSCWVWRQLCAAVSLAPDGGRIGNFALHIHECKTGVFRIHLLDPFEQSNDHADDDATGSHT